MKRATIFALLLASIVVACSQSSTVDPTPDPTPTPTPTPATCRYVMNYRISYPALSKTKFTTITYLDSTQKVRTAVLTDTSFSLRVSYKSGDSVYVRLNPNLYFLDNKVSKRINYGKSIMGASSICTRQDYINNGNFPVAAGDSLASSAVGQVLGSFGISPRRLD